MDLEPSVRQSVGDPGAFQSCGNGQSIFQREMDKVVRVDGQSAVVVRWVNEPVTCVIHNILCIYAAIRADGVSPDSVNELWGIYGDDAGGGCGGYDGIKSG